MHIIKNSQICKKELGFWLVETGAEAKATAQAKATSKAKAKTNVKLKRKPESSSGGGQPSLDLLAIECNVHWTVNMELD